MEGFFSKSETTSTSRPFGKAYTCASCGLSKGAKHPKMEAFGNFKKQILVISISPSQADDIKGLPYQDESGKLLKQIFSQFGIDLMEDCLSIYSTRCYSKEIPSKYQVVACSSWVNSIIKEYQPKIIITFGWESFYQLIHSKWKGDFYNIDRWRGFQIPDQELKAWLCPVFDYRNLSKEKKEIQTIFKMDLEKAIRKVDEPFLRHKKPEIEIIQNLHYLKSIKSDVIAFDYETTGLKPHKNGHRIICASVANNENHAFVFMIPDNKDERLPFLKLLTNPMIGKMAHNMKFEHNWSLVRLRVEVNYWEWDSMLAAHVLDNRPNITGLKFQAYINFGITDYSSEISPYLFAKKDEGANGFNRITELIETKEGRKKLLTYCAFDSIYEHRLALLQMNKMNYHFLPF